MPTKYRILNVIHFTLFVILSLMLVATAFYALEGESMMEMVCAFVTHFDGQPHTGISVTTAIEAYSLIPILIISILLLLLVNKIVYACTVKKYQKTHYITNKKVKAKSGRKLFANEAPTTSKVIEETETEETPKMKKVKKEKQVKETKKNRKLDAATKEVVKAATTDIEKGLEKADVKIQSATSQLEDILKNLRK